ncbi:MAG: GldG family protein [Patescibacteria group bacterium]|jgi:gliding-associated putative ABC transporter substrate-binding component GldG
MKKILTKLNKSLTIILVIAILAVINFISYRFFYRLDLTETGVFSISKASRETVGNIDDVVNIKAYFSENLPAQFIALRQETADILAEYETYGQGKIKVEFIDPGDDEELKSRIYSAGIPPLQLNVMEKDKYQIMEGYMGMTIGYGDKTEVIPVIQGTEDLEYQVTAAIKKASAKETQGLGWLTGYGTIAPEERSAAAKNLAQIYSAEDVDLKQIGEIPKNIKTLIIAGPTEKFDEKALKAVDGFLFGGGNLLVLLDGVKVGEGLSAEKNVTGLEGLLEKYGIKVENNLVLDGQSGIASFNQGFITFSVEYPYWPKILKDGFDKEVSAVSNLETVVLPWVSGVDVIKDKLSKESNVSFLLMSSDKAWKVASGFNLSPQNIPAPASSRGKYSLAVLATGNFQSAYESGKTFSSRIAVVGDSDFIKDSFLRNAPDNLALFQNLTDILSLDEDLINIRSKGVTSRPVKELSEAGKATARYGNVFGVTAIVIALGAVRYISRRRRKESGI